MVMNGDWKEPRSYLRTEDGHQFDLVANRIYFFGRGDACDIRLDDSGCSRRHAKLSVGGDPSVVYIEDLGSKNGTFLNGCNVGGRVLLKDGDEIRIGTTPYRIYLWREAVSLEMDTRTTLGDKND